MKQNAPIQSGCRPCPLVPHRSYHLVSWTGRASQPSQWASRATGPAGGASRHRVHAAQPPYRRVVPTGQSYLTVTRRGQGCLSMEHAHQAFSGSNKCVLACLRRLALRASLLSASHAHDDRPGVRRHAHHTVGSTRQHTPPARGAGEVDSFPRSTAGSVHQSVFPPSGARGFPFTGHEPATLGAPNAWDRPLLPPPQVTE